MENNQVMVKMILERWFALIKNFDTTFSMLSDEDLQREISPGRNRGIYLLGHMVAVHDDMVRLLDFGNKQFPELYDTFIAKPDRAIADLPSAQELRANWADQVDYMSAKINAMTPEQWFEKHTAVSDEDFAKEPHRNKLNIMLTRCTHMAYHHAQVILLTPKKVLI